MKIVGLQKKNFREKKRRLEQNMLIDINQIKIKKSVSQRFLTIFYTYTGMDQSKTGEH